MLVVAVALGIIALAEQALEPRRRAARRKAVEKLTYRHLTGSLTVAWLFEVFQEDPGKAGLDRASVIIATWAVDVTDALSVAAPHKTFGFGNDQGGPLPPYRGLSREQAASVGLLERHVARLGRIIEEVEAELA
jgi:hypothetical protein